MNNLFLDMDGVLADFVAGVEREIGAASAWAEWQQLKQQPHWPKQWWQTLAEAQPRLFANLPETSWAHELVAVAKQFEQCGYVVRVLTAIPQHAHMPDVYYDKCMWIAQRWPELSVWFGPTSTEKQRFARPHDILVDDRTDNCEQWRAGGGSAVQCFGAGVVDQLRGVLKFYKG